jgi:hypothetical protein
MHSRRPVPFALALLCIPLLLGISPGMQPEAGQRKQSLQAGTLVPAPAIYVQITGHNAKREQEGFVVARTEKGWIGIWQDYTGNSAGHGAIERNRIPKISFDACMVVACFGGKRTNTDGFIAEELALDNGELRLRYTESTFQTSGPGGGGQNTTPYAVWIIPATDKPITIERGRRGLKDAPIKWERVHTVTPVDGT